MSSHRFGRVTPTTSSRPSRFRLGFPVAPLVLALILCACASAPKDAARSANPASMAAPAAAPTGAPAAAVPAGASASAAGTTSSSGGADYLPIDRMVIRNAKVSLQVQNVETALTRVRTIADTYGGYVSASSTSYEKADSSSAPDRMVADITIAVRSDAYDRAMSDLRQLATKVDREDGTSQDVTEEYVDLDSDLRNLQASQDALLKLMGTATRLEDVLTLQQQLSNVQGQIQRIEGRKRYLEHATSMATISISLRLPPLAQPGETAWSPLASFERGWKASLALLQGVADVAIVAVSFLWWMVPLVAGGYVLYRRERRSRAAAP